MTWLKSCLQYFLILIEINKTDETTIIPPPRFLGSAFLGDLRETIFNIALWPRDFFVQPVKARTIATEKLVALFSPLN